MGSSAGRLPLPDIISTTRSNWRSKIMSITILRPRHVTVEITGRGYGTAENAATIAGKALGLVVRGSRYYAKDGTRAFMNRDELTRILRGYRWLVRHGDRWFVALPAKAVELMHTALGATVPTQAPVPHAA
jgi:hypothetical protein